MHAAVFEAPLLENSPTLEEMLPPPLLQHILQSLEAGELGRAACVSRSLREAAEADHLWRPHAAQRFLVGVGAAEADVEAGGGARGPDGAATASWRSAFCAWALAFRGYAPADVTAALRAWRAVERWTEAHFPEVRRSLRAGATEEALSAAATELGLPEGVFPAALRLLHRVHEGQALLLDQVRSEGAHQLTPQERASIFHGLFGGYTFYEHLVNVRLLPLEKVVATTSMCREAGLLAPRSSAVVFAASFNFSKLFLVDAATGAVEVVGKNRKRLPAAPAGPDALLRWFGTFADRLAEGYYEPACMDPSGDPSTRAISLFPRRGPDLSVAVTRGVQVAASALFVPEQSTPGKEFFTYSVRFSMVSREEQLERWREAGPPRALASAQLRSRHWLISNRRGQVDEVRGEAVVGMYPIVRPGHPDFVYQSCTGLSSAPGSMRGEFCFVEGTIAEPAGADFDAECAAFALRVPEYVY